MPDEKPKSAIGLETFKAFSVFLSSVVIALATFFATREYNSQQLEISRNKALSELIPKLGDQDEKMRKFSAISLAMYGEKAVPALMASLRDDKQEVRHAAVTALGIIGTPAAPVLVNAFNDKRKEQVVRAASLYALGLMRYEPAYVMAEAALKDRNEDGGVRIDAAEVLGMFKEKRAVNTLLSVLKQKNDTLLIQKSLESLSKIKNVAETSPVKSLLYHPSETVRVWALWTIQEIGDTSAMNDLRRVDSVDTSDKVRGYARRVIESLQTAGGVSP
jgi:HEAT repeat protein